jgi:AcrR family transcriptional regulator
MARTQARDFEERRARIVEQAALLFASRGFLGASIADLAEACRASKSLLYHYYPSKEDILFDVMHSHVKALLDAAERRMTEAAPPRESLRALTRDFVALYAGAAARHKVLLNELPHLPPLRRAVIVGIQRKLIGIVEELVGRLQPALATPSPLRLPAAMLYFGMINWMHTWFDPSGPATPDAIADLAAATFLDGIETLQFPLPREAGREG